MKALQSFALFLLITLSIVLGGPLHSQPIKVDTVKTTKPIFTATLSIYSGAAKALTGDVKRLMINNPVIKVKDAKGTEYKVVAFEVTWKRKELSEDLKSGKPKVVYYMVGADVKTNQLPNLLRQQIGSNLQTGEEIMLSNILYYDPKKKLNYKADNFIVLSII